MLVAQKGNLSKKEEKCSRFDHPDAVLTVMKQICIRFVTLLVILLVSACDRACENERISSVQSPSGNLTAVIFNRNCGATTGFNTQVSVVKASEKLPDDGGNVLILGDSHDLKVKWKSETELLIYGAGQGQSFKKDRSISGVSILYE